METDKLASTHLGKKSAGSTSYDPSLLVAIPRIENRKQYNIANSALPFEGWDVWHAYEFSAMSKNGIPITRLLKLKYSCDSEFLVESKSLKLYLNSFNMDRFGQDTQECLNICKKLIEQDLSKALKTPVVVNFLDNKAKRVEIFDNFKNIMNFVNEKELDINHFKETPEILEIEPKEESSEYY